jgi:hypothetical protein
VYPLTPDAPVCELFSVDMGVCGGHMREKVQANGADCRNLRPTISRNLAVGREKRKCLPRWAERAGVASAGMATEAG